MVEQAGAAANARKPFFLFMTGELVHGDMAEDLAVAGAQTLQKPFRISELMAILTDAIVGTPANIGGQAKPE
jgi:hypothetical protein